MQVIKLEDRVIYRSANGKKVKFIDGKSSFSEIVVKEETNKIVEVDK